MSAVYDLRPIPLYNFYLLLIFILSTWLRIHQYRTILAIVAAVPGRWPKLFGLMRRHSTIFLTKETVLPLVLTLGLLLVNFWASRVLWSTATFTVHDLLTIWPALCVVAPTTGAMLAFDIKGALEVEAINRADVEKQLDQAEYWLRSWAAPVLSVFSLGHVNPRRMVAEEVRKSLTDACASLNSGLWWAVRQTVLRGLCGLSLYGAWLLEPALRRWLYGG